MTLSKYQRKNMTQEEIDAHEATELFYDEERVYGGHIIVEEEDNGQWKITAYDDYNCVQDNYEGDTRNEVEEYRKDLEDLLGELADWDEDDEEDF